jgi:hypothetical protein
VCIYTAIFGTAEEEANVSAILEQQLVKADAHLMGAVLQVCVCVCVCVRVCVVKADAHSMGAVLQVLLGRCLSHVTLTLVT